MLLHDLLGAADVLELVGDSHVAVLDIAHDSHRVIPGSLFCCVPGARVDGHEFAGAAVERGAVAVLVERLLPLDVPQARVASVRRAVGPIAARFHGEPSSALAVLGVTGTNGKTTVTYLLEAIGQQAGQVSGVIGTTGARVGAAEADVGFTTPEAPELQSLLAWMRDAGARIVAVEVSSHALSMHRVDGTRFAVSCFTNFSQDHLDLHGSLEEYFEAKARLFTPELTGTGVVNGDDVMGARLAARSLVPTVTFALEAVADVTATEILPGRDGASFVLHAPAYGPDAPVRLRLLGRFNVSNAVAAAATALVAGVPLDAVVRGLEVPVVVPGRLERIDAGQPFGVFVDYAHTPDGLATVLAAARDVATGRVIAVFGCGGDRDPGKRPAMGRAVGEAADVVVLTSDNPRSEAPAAIAAAAAAGLEEVDTAYTVELDRRAAIRLALGGAAENDVVLVLGKGSEQGQTIGETTVPFDDRVVVREELEALAWT